VIVAVAGGKGGAGKTFISTSLALVQAPLQFVDCDVEEPNAHLFLEPAVKKWEQVSITIPYFRKWKGGVCREGAEFCRFRALAVVNGEMLVFPELCTSCGGCFLLCPEETLQPRPHQVGLIKMGGAKRGIDFIAGELRVGQQRTEEVIRAVKERMNPGENAVIDCPPGSGRPARVALEGADFCLMVTEPTPFGLHDIQGNKKLLDVLKIPAGVVINRSGSGYDGILRWCGEEGIPLLAEIPFDFEIARAAARGLTLTEIDASWERRLQNLWSDVEGLVQKG
jgi:MinD superfamily P-loop ATPase